MTTQQIRQRLESILDFMQPYWEFVNCHMVNYITDKHWQRHIPLEIREEISNVEDVRYCIETNFWRDDSHNSSIKYPIITNFIRKCEKYRLSNFKEILRTPSDLNNELSIDNKGDSKVSIKEFMTNKKRHEVEIVAEIVNKLITKYSNDNDVYIVDAGDGKGYLSSRLALQYNHKVLGIDVNEINTENALQRSRKLQRAWNGLVQRAELMERGITPPRRGKKTYKEPNIQNKNQSSNYYTTARYIDTDLNMEALLNEYFPEVTEKSVICLSGLHTCGNLAAVCLRVFHMQTNCKILCNIGCCYHFLKEAFTEQKDEHDKPNNDEMEIAFPMSEFLQEKHIRMGRNARMLAAQSIERTLSARELPNISLFYRALLEVLIYKQNPDLIQINRETVQVGRIRKFKNFEEYVEQCAKKIDLIELKSLNVEVIKDIELEYAENQDYLELFYLLRMLFAPILETIILLDRLLYLKELGYQKSFLVTAFDAVISPRHYAVIAIKD